MKANKHNLITGISLAGIVGVTAGVFAWQHDKWEQYDRDEAAVEQLVTTDGLEADVLNRSYNKQTEKSMAVSLDLGHCMLHGITVEIDRDDEGEVVDTTGYSYEGYVLSHDVRKSNPGNGTGSRMVTEGVPVTFKFQDREDLEANLLGPEPCKTLAQQSTTLR